VGGVAGYLAVKIDIGLFGDSDVLELRHLGGIYGGLLCWH
jgi:hypothetical protein